jgi:hypothetical protein
MSESLFDDMQSFRYRGLTIAELDERIAFWDQHHYQYQQSTIDIDDVQQQLREREREQELEQKREREREQEASLGTITCHKIDSVFRYGDEPIHWTYKGHGRSPDPFSHCSYCGSIHFDDVRHVLHEGGRLGGADWKYGYPHKFYVYSKDGSIAKFYTDHLVDIPQEQFAEFAALLLAATGIEFSRDEKGIKYRAPYHGYQR